MLHHFIYCRVLYRVKGLFKIKLDNYDLLLGLMALMYIFKGPSQAILYGSRSNESILIYVNNFQDNPLQSICQDLCYKLETVVQ